MANEEGCLKLLLVRQLALSGVDDAPIDTGHAQGMHTVHTVGELLASAKHDDRLTRTEQAVQPSPALGVKIEVVGARLDRRTVARVSALLENRHRCLGNRLPVRLAPITAAGSVGSWYDSDVVSTARRQVFDPHDLERRTRFVVTNVPRHAARLSLTVVLLRSRQIAPNAASGNGRSGRTAVLKFYGLRDNLRDRTRRVSSAACFGV